MTALFCALLWLVCLALYTRANTFAYYYHPDEEGKAKQAALGSRNFNHPQMLLEVSSLAVGVTGAGNGMKKDLGKGPTPEKIAAHEQALQATTVVGRWVAAGFAAGAVVVLALAARRAAGPAGMVMAAAAVGLSPSLLLYAHYFKEDTALIFGLSLVVLAAAILGRRVRDDSDSTDRAKWWAVAALGAACGAAASGKYVGLTGLAFALPLLWAWRRRLPPRAWRAFVAGLVGVVLIVNIRAVGNLATWQRKIGQQVVDGMVEHEGLTMRKPSGYFVRAVWQETPGPILALAGLAAVLLAVTWRTSASSARLSSPKSVEPRRSAWDAAVVVFPVAFLGLVSFSSAPNNRHVLPVVVMAHLLAALAVAWAVEAIKPMRLRPVVGWAVAAAFVTGMTIGLGPRCVNYIGQFANDSRVQAREWVAANLPPGTSILQDSAASLDEPPGGSIGEDDGPGGTKVIGYKFAPQVDESPNVRDPRTRYVAVCDLAYGRYFDPYVVPAKGSEGKVAHRREWYERLFSRPDLLVKEWSPSPDTHSSTNPTIRIYQVPEP